MRKRVILALLFVVILFGFLNFFFINYFGIPLSPVAITGFAINDSGIVQIFIDKLMNIVIYSPENITYNFSKGDSYIIPLNVSADFSVDEWRYSLFDLEHNVSVESDVVFVPNSSISAVRWGNLLTVFAHETDGSWWSEDVVFFVDVPNSAPILGNISEPVFFCEGGVANYDFNASDVDEDDLVGDISPKNPFYLFSGNRVNEFSFFSIISGVLDKGDVGSYVESISVLDPWGGIDSRDIDVEVIEINNEPVLEDMGAQTVWLSGDNSTFYHVVDVSDIEDGDAFGGNLEFSLTWSGGENLFDVGLNDGVMNYSPVVGHEGRVYSLTTCVEDNNLSSLHDNISLCLPHDGNKKIVCDNWTLTVSDENRAPIVVNWSPVNSTFGVSGSDHISFSSEVYDADGTIPDIDWFVDGVLKEHNEVVSNDSFVYSFGCEVEGAHRVEIITSDGLLNDSREWNIMVSSVECPVSSSGGGGGGGGGDYCVEEWVCDDWDVCQNVKRSFDSNILSLEDYAAARDVCLQNKEEDDRYCGFQITSCHDLNSCGRVEPVIERPIEKRFCYFSENPNCHDGFTNCHDGGCELLVDCGGPCSPCATCSDGKQNQGEEGVDCGGPCPYLCEPEVPFAMLSSVLIVLAILLVIVILFVSWRLFLLWKKREEDEQESSSKD